MTCLTFAVFFLIQKRSWRISFTYCHCTVLYVCQNIANCPEIYVDIRNIILLICCFVFRNEWSFFSSFGIECYRCFRTTELPVFDSSPAKFPPNTPAFRNWSGKAQTKSAFSVGVVASRSGVAQYMALEKSNTAWPGAEFEQKTNILIVTAGP